jgi:hypothetical protein
MDSVAADLSLELEHFNKSWSVTFQHAKSVSEPTYPNSLMTITKKITIILTCLFTDRNQAKVDFGLNGRRSAQRVVAFLQTDNN